MIYLQTMLQEVSSAAYYLNATPIIRQFFAGEGGLYIKHFHETEY